MDILLMFSGISILVTLFIAILFVGGLPALMIFKNEGNEKIASTLGTIIAIILCQSTFNSYLNEIGNMQVIGVIIMMIFFIIFSVPFVTYGFPDFTFPGRALLTGGVITCLFSFLNIPFLNLDLSNIFSNQIILYISCFWSLWNIIAFIRNPNRTKRAFDNIFKGKISEYKEGNFE